MQCTNWCRACGPAVENTNHFQIQFIRTTIRDMTLTQLRGEHEIREEYIRSRVTTTIPTNT